MRILGAVMLVVVLALPVHGFAQAVRCVDVEGNVYYGTVPPAGVTCVKQDDVAMPKQPQETAREKLRRERETSNIYRSQDQRKARENAKAAEEKAAQEREEITRRMEHECGKAEAVEIVSGMKPSRSLRLQCDEFYKMGGRARVHPELEQRR